MVMGRCGLWVGGTVVDWDWDCVQFAVCSGQRWVEWSGVG